MAFEWFSDAVGDVVDWGADALPGAWDAISGQTSFDPERYSYDPIAGVYSGTYGGASYENDQRMAAMRGMNAADRALAQQTQINQAAAGIRDASTGLMGKAAGIEKLSDDFGAAPSYADAASKATIQRLNADAMTRAASARGANSALQLREQAAANDQTARMAATEAAATKAKEMSDRFATRGSLLGQAAGVTSSGISGLGTAAQLTSKQADQLTAAAGQEYDREQGAAQRDLAMRQDVTQAETQRHQTQANSLNQQQQTRADLAKQNANNLQGTTGGILQTVGSIFGLSDVRAKEDIEMLDDDLEDRQDEFDDTMAENDAALDKRRSRYAGGASSGGGGGLFGGLLSDVDAKEDAELMDELDRAAEETEAGIRGTRRPSRQERELDDRADIVARALRSARATYPELRDPEGNRRNLGELEPYRYRYKPSFAEAVGEDTRPRVGIMAQDMERAPAGRSVVHETPNGKALDINRGLGFSLAAAAGLDKRMKAIEDELGGETERPNVRAPDVDELDRAYAMSDRRNKRDVQLARDLDRRGEIVRSALRRTRATYPEL